MIFQILLVSSALIAAAQGAATDSCVLGEWGDWSDCLSSKGCPKEEGKSSRSAASSFSVPPAGWDSGRLKMDYMMRKKNAFWANKEKCLASKTCPEYEEKVTMGPEPCVNGMSGENPCRNIDRLSFVDFYDLGYINNAPGERKKEANDIWGWTDSRNWDEYAIIGLTGGTSFVRVTDPENPVPVAFIYTHTSASVWRDMKVIGNWVYIVSEASNHGMQIFDLTRLRGLTSMNYLEPDVHYNRVGNSHNIVANPESGYVYIVGATRGSGYNLCRGGLHVVDVRNPRSPKFAGCFGGDGYVHDAQCTYYHGPDLRYIGREICLCFNEDTFTIVDVNDKDDMKVISKEGYTGSQYTHQGWFTEDHTVVLLDDELDENRSWSDKRTKTYMWDVTDMERPTLRNTYIHADTSIDHNQYVLGDITYQANYEAGLRILHIEQENYDLNEVAYFDVFPTTRAEFNGLWSVYPYFRSRNLAISSIDYGLYMVRPDYDAIDAAIASKKRHSEQTRSRDVIFRAEGATCPAVRETRTCNTNVKC